MADAPTEELTSREREIAAAYSGGESYQQIAVRLCIAPSTVRTHLATIYRKHGVSSKLELHKRLDLGGQPLPVEGLQTALPDVTVSQLERLPLENEAEAETISDCVRQAGIPG